MIHLSFLRHRLELTCSRTADTLPAARTLPLYIERRDAYYDASRDARRFLMINEFTTGGATSSQLVIVLNGFEELKRLAPTSNESVRTWNAKCSIVRVWPGALSRSSPCKSRT